MNTFSFSSFLFAAFISITAFAQNWSPVGTQINGTAAQDQSGFSISLNGTGTIVAVGAPYNDGNGTDSGHARVFENSGGNWTQLGTDIIGGTGDNLGYSLALNAAGNRLVVGSPHDTPNGNLSGSAAVYDYVAGNWVQVGATINSAYILEETGISVDISDDGSIIALGSLKDNNSSMGGSARVYVNNGGNWTLMGSPILGSVTGEQLGRNISLSGDGLTIALGSPYYNSSMGYVRVFRFIAGNWVQVGPDILGNVVGDNASKVSLNADGTILAIGSPLNDENLANAGKIRVYQEDNGVWAQLGGSIYGDAANIQQGISLALNAEGTILITGATTAANNGLNSGKIQAYRYLSGSWTAYGAPAVGQTSPEYLGFSVAISADGCTIAGGGNRNMTAGTLAGTVRVFDCSIVALPVELTDFQLDVLANNRVLVNWTTLSERNTDHFSIERSADGKNWQTIGQLKAASNSTERIDYAFYDNSPLTGINYYRIVTVDLDGNESTSDVQSTSFISSEARCRVFPNPSAGKIAIETGSDPVEICITNASGNVFVKEVVTGHFETTLSTGLYFVHFSGNGFQVTEKLIVH